MAWVRCCGEKGTPSVKYIVKNGVIEEGTADAPSGTSLSYDSVNNRLVETTTDGSRYCYIRGVFNISNYTKLCVTYANSNSVRELIVNLTIDGTAGSDTHTSRDTNVHTVTIPISGNTLSVIMFLNQAGGSTSYIYDMWLE